MVRRIVPMLALLAVLVAACGGAGTPALTDPKEIITKGLEATANLKSLHLELTVAGTITEPSSGTSFDLAGTTLGGDVDIANKKTHLTFKVPALLSLSGEVITVDEVAYVKTTLTGAKWQKQEATGSSDPVSQVTDPKQAIEELKKFLDKEGVETKKLADAKCGERDCYQVELTIPASVLEDAAAAASSSPGEIGSMFPDGLTLQLAFDREKLYLSSAAMDVEAGDQGSLTLSATLSKFDEPVTVEEPPASEVDESGGGLTLP